MKLDIKITPNDIQTDLKAIARFFYIFSVSLGVFLIFSILYGVENLIKTTYILTKPTIVDIIAIYFLQYIIDILPFVVIFSLAYFAYKLNYNTLKDIIRLSVFLGIFIYIVFFVFILFSPSINNLVLNAYRNFSTSPSTPKFLFTKSKIHLVGDERVIPLSVQKNYFNAVVVKNGKTTFYNNLKVVPFDNGVRIKSSRTTLFEIPYEKIIPSSFGKLYERIYRGFLKVATQFPLTKYVEKFNFANFLNLMLYVQALTIGIIYVVWIFRDFSTTKVLLLSVFVAVLGVTVIGFLSGVFEFMRFSSLLESIKDIVSGLLALALAILVVMGAYKVEQIVRGKVGG